MKARQQEHARGGRLGRPPGAPKKTVLAALHAASCKIQNQGGRLNRGIDGRRTGKGAHQRIGFKGTLRDGAARGVGVEGGGAVLGERQSDPLSAGRQWIGGDNSSWFCIGRRNADERKRFRAAYGRNKRCSGRTR